MMKKTLVALYLAFGSFACAADTTPVVALNHQVSILSMSTGYKEGKIDNDYNTIGIGYAYVQPVGYNALVQIPIITGSGKHEHGRFAFENSYKFLVGDHLSLAPIVGISADYRGLKRDIEKNRKGILDEKVFLGASLTQTAFESLDMTLKALITQDIHRSVTREIASKNHWVIEVSKKTGVRLIPSLKYSFTNRFSAEVSGIFAKSFNGGYTEKGMQLAVSCGI